MRGKGGAGKVKQSSLSLKEHVENRNFTFVHPNNISKRNPAPTFHSTVYKEEILTCIDLLLDFKVKPVEPQKNRPASLSGEQVNRRDATKPALRYAPQLQRIVGLEDSPFLTFDQVKELSNMCNEELAELVKYLKSVDFVTEAQEFRIATLDGLVSFPVGCFYRSRKGS